MSGNATLSENQNEISSACVTEANASQDMSEERNSSTHEPQAQMSTSAAAMGETSRREPRWTPGLTKVTEETQHTSEEESFFPVWESEASLGARDEEPSATAEIATAVTTTENTNQNERLTKIEKMQETLVGQILELRELMQQMLTKQELLMDTVLKIIAKDSSVENKTTSQTMRAERNSPTYTGQDQIHPPHDAEATAEYTSTATAQPEGTKSPTFTVTLEGSYHREVAKKKATRQPRTPGENLPYFCRRHGGANRSHNDEDCFSRKKANPTAIPSIPSCTFCKKTGHQLEYCYDARRHFQDIRHPRNVEHRHSRRWSEDVDRFYASGGEDWPPENY